MRDGERDVVGEGKREAVQDSAATVPGVGPSVHGVETVVTGPGRLEARIFPPG